MFKVNTGKLAAAFAQGGGWQAKLQGAGQRVGSCIGGLYALGSDYGGICSGLRSSQGELLQIAAELGAWVNALDEIRRLYETAESEIAGFGSGTPVAGGTEGAAGSGEKKVFRRGGPLYGPVAPGGARKLSVRAGSDNRKDSATSDNPDGQNKAKTAETADMASGGIDAGARRQLLSAGITDRQIDEWEKEGLSLTSKEAKQYLPLLVAAAAGYKSVSQEEFKEQISQQLSEEDLHAASSGNGNPARQAEILNKAAGVLLSCYPTVAMSMDRKVEVPVGPGVSMYCEVSGSGKGVSNNSVKVTETLDAHTGKLKEGIALSTEGGSVSFSETGRSLTFKTDAGKLKTDGSSISWSASGDISEDTTYSLQIKVNAQTGETVCEESLTTKVEKAEITTAIGIKSENKPSGPVPMPGMEEAVKSRERAQAIEALLISAMAPDMLGDTEAVLEGLGLLSLQTAGR